MRRERVLLAAALGAALLAASALAGQVASPGRLGGAHAELEGIRRCTECHTLRRPGIDPQRCLACHEPLRTRIERAQGLHGRLEERSCGGCHKDHLGEGGALVRLDTARFRHSDTGWELEGAHGRVRCSGCHRAEFVTAADVREFRGHEGFLDRTLLGVERSCHGCHGRDDPHGGQFGERGCAECHDARSWEEAPGFDHDRTSYPLTGAHARVECAACHSAGAGTGTVAWRGVEHGDCRSCHTDPHRGVMGATCAGCHATAAWSRLDVRSVTRRFDHARTRFRLEGAHADAACGACHAPGRRGDVRLRFSAATRNATFPAPAFGTCGTCHVDRHEGVFGAVAAACGECHGQTKWTPVGFGIASHQRTRFPLRGDHLLVTCAECHTTPVSKQLRFRFADTDCAACHAADDPHGSQFTGRRCMACHEDGTFAVRRFDHSTTRFPLEGEHASVPCSGCHGAGAAGAAGARGVRYRPLETACRSCHGGPQ